MLCFGFTHDRECEKLGLLVQRDHFFSVLDRTELGLIRLKQSLVSILPDDTDQSILPGFSARVKRKALITITPITRIGL